MTPHYANPLADYDSRRTLVERWARAISPQQLAADLDRSSYRPPTVFVLRTKSDGLHMSLSRDIFPQEPNVEYYDVRFDPGLFAEPLFRTRRVGPFTVAVRR